MSRRLIFVENLEIYGNKGMWDNEGETEENREQRWQLMERIRTVIDNNLASLTDRQLYCVNAMLSGISYSDMSRMLNITYPVARSHYFKAVRKLRVYLENPDNHVHYSGLICP
jgi:DNA-directed RNA polymerase specialized sigma24 family protein